MMWRSALRRWLLRIGNLVVLHAANPSDYHDTGPVITSKFHASKISVPIIRRIVAMRLYILFQMYVNYFTKQRVSQRIIVYKKRKSQEMNENTTYLLFGAIIRNRI